MPVRCACTSTLIAAPILVRVCVSHLHCLLPHPVWSASLSVSHAGLCTSSLLYANALSACLCGLSPPVAILCIAIPLYTFIPRK